MSPEQLNAYLNAEASTVKIPYLVIGCVIIVILLFAVTKLPEVKEDDSAAHGTKFSLNVFKFSHVRWAVFAEFCYVGSQVGVGSFFVRFSKYLMDLPEKDAGYWWGSIAMVGFMVGRFAGTFFYALYKACKAVNLICSNQYTINCVCIGKPQSVFSVRSDGNTILHVDYVPDNLCTRHKKGLRRNKIASSFLVMSIIGGGVIAPIMGLISDATGSIQSAYIVPVFASR